MELFLKNIMIIEHCTIILSECGQKLYKVLKFLTVTSG